MANPAEDIDLDAIFQALVTGVTGLPGEFVRPRWQPKPPKQPEHTTNWCAIGVTVQKANDGPQITYDPTIDASRYTRHEEIEVLATFYGPNAQSNAAIMRDGIAIGQNTEGLLAYDMRWFTCGEILTVPELTNQLWIRRYDMTLGFRRKITRLYGVLSLLSTSVHLFDDTYGVDDTIEVTQNAPPAP